VDDLDLLDVMRAPEIARELEAIAKNRLIVRGMVDRWISLHLVTFCEGQGLHQVTYRASSDLVGPPEEFKFQQLDDLSRLTLVWMAWTPKGGELTAEALVSRKSPDGGLSRLPPANFHLVLHYQKLCHMLAGYRNELKQSNGGYPEWVAVDFVLGRLNAFFRDRIRDWERVIG